MQLSSRPTSSSALATTTVTPQLVQPDDTQDLAHQTLGSATTEPTVNSLSEAASDRWPGLGVFCSTFVTIFLAELGDKTQMTTLLMSAESQSPWMVFAGAAIALITTSLLGVLVGRWLANRLSPKTLETAAGAALLLVSVLLFWDIAHS